VPQRIALAELSPGESICHDGACLTVTEIGGAGPVRDAYHVLAGLVLALAVLVRRRRR